MCVKPEETHTVPMHCSWAVGKGGGGKINQRPDCCATKVVSMKVTVQLPHQVYTTENCFVGTVICRCLFIVMVSSFHT